MLCFSRKHVLNTFVDLTYAVVSGGRNATVIGRVMVDLQNIRMNGLDEILEFCSSIDLAHVLRAAVSLMLA